MTTPKAEIQRQMQAQIMRAMPYAPISLDVLRQNAGFYGGDAQMVRALVSLNAMAVQMMGYVPANIPMLASLLGVDSQWLQEHQGQLLQGWQQDGEYWMHEHYVQMAQDLFERYQAQLKEWHTEAMAYASTAGLEFEPLKLGVKRAKVARALKEPMTLEEVGQSVLDAFAARGIDNDDDRRFVVAQCSDYHIARATRIADKDATLRTWISRVNLSALPSAQRSAYGVRVINAQQPLRANNYGSRGEVAAQNNLAGFEELMANQQGKRSGSMASTVRPNTRASASSMRPSTNAYSSTRPNANATVLPETVVHPNQG